MSSMRSSQYVEVQLEIGHKATPKVKHTPEGHTHDWTVFVRGPENSNIQHFVEKVVFHLHESFPKPKRVVKEPPYQVSESGYASFELPVEVYFKNKEEPKKICFDYDLYLRLDDAVSHSRREKLTFQNPSNDFKKKLLKAGGVTNESNGSAAKSGVPSEDKPTAQTPTPTPNTTKPNKSNVNESKRAKTSGVIPSKDKSLTTSQSISSSSNPPSNPSVPDKPFPSSNNKQFTDLFGTPIQARSSETSKKDNFTSKSKFGAIPSKGLKNESKTSHKSSSKKSFPSPSHKPSDNKSSKELKDNSKSDTKLKDSTKGRREESSDSKTKKKSQPQSPKTSYDLDKKQDFKASKKRRNSTSSNSSSLTTSSFSGGTDTKPHKETQKPNQTKDKDNKKENKKQKVSSKDINSASGVKKQSSTSTKISFSDNNSSTTIEIKSVKKEKTWDNEVKKSRSKEFKSSEYKASKDKANPSNAGSSLGPNKTKSKTDDKCLNSPKVDSNKYLKSVAKDKHSSRPRKRSPSVSSDSTPLLSSPPSNSAPNYLTNADMESHESLSPLSSDNTSSDPLRFKPIRNNQENKDRFDSDDSDSDQSDLDHSLKSKDKKRSNFRDLTSNEKQRDYSTPASNKRKKDQSKESNKRLESSQNTVSHCPTPNFGESFLINELMEMQKKINESTNRDLLQRVVDLIEEESAQYSLTKTTFDFDLMKLEPKLIETIKSYLS